MSRTKRDKRGGHENHWIEATDFGFGNAWGTMFKTPAEKRFYKRQRRRKHRAYGRIRIADMLQMHEDYLEDRDYILYGEPGEYEFDDDYEFYYDDDYRHGWNDDYDRYDYDDDPYDDYDYGYDDYYDYEPDPEPRYEVYDRESGNTLAEGYSLGDLLAQIQFRQRQQS